MFQSIMASYQSFVTPKKLTALERKFWRSARDGNAKNLTICLREGVNVDTVNTDGEFEENALISACINNHLEIVSILLNNGATIDMQRKDGFNALNVSSWHGHLEIVRFLINSGADVNSVTQEHGQSPIDSACYNGHLDVVTLLLDNGAHIDIQRNCGISPIYISAQQGHLDVIRCLVNRGADVNLAKNDGSTALHIASQLGHLQIVQYLINHGAATHLSTDSGAKPVDVAQLSNQVNIVHLLENVPILWNGLEIETSSQEDDESNTQEEDEDDESNIEEQDEVDESNTEEEESDLNSICIYQFEWAQYEETFLREKDLNLLQQVVVNAPDGDYRGILKWSGILDGRKCVGVELNDTVDFGTSGKFNGNRLFQCEQNKGIVCKVHHITLDTQYYQRMSSVDQTTLPDCRVCMIYESCMAFTRCGHICVCEICSNRLSLCPICQSPGQALKIYIS